MLSWSMWLCASLFYAYQYILRVIPNILKDDLTNTFEFDTLLFGQFVGIYYVGYTLAHIPLGLALDRYGPRKVLPLATFISVLGLIPMLTCSDCGLVILGRFILGLGSSCAFIGLVKVVSIAFTPDKFNKLLAYGSIFGLVGGVFSGAPVHYLLKFFGWQTVISIFIFLGCLLSFILFLVLPSCEKQEVESPLIPLKAILTNKWFWMVAVASGCMAGPLEGYADAWLAQSLRIIYNVTPSFASHGSSLIYLGFAFGLAGLSTLSDKIGLDRVIILSGIMMLCVFCLIMSGLLPTNTLFIAIFVLGFFAAYQVPALCKAATLMPSKLTSLTTATANTYIMFFGMLFHSVLGGCVHFFGQSCDNHDFQKGFFIIPLMLTMGIILFSYVYIQHDRINRKKMDISEK